jgi:hypothetical protein
MPPSRLSPLPPEAGQAPESAADAVVAGRASPPSRRERFPMGNTYPWGPHSESRGSAAVQRARRGSGHPSRVGRDDEPTRLTEVPSAGSAHTGTMVLGDGRTYLRHPSHPP